MPSLKSLVTLGPKAKQNRIEIHPSATAKTGKIVIKGSNCVVEIGEGVSCKHVELYLIADNSIVRIGKRTRVNNSLWASLAEPNTMLEFGDDCLIASVIARTSDSHQIIDIATGERLNPPGDIIVGAHVWLAQEVMLLKRTRIGANSIIGARSMVNRELPSNAVCAGVPARVLRTGVTWDERISAPSDLCMEFAAE
jgi:acetyltransferase-like isoleucine patch superfamily enzyme